MPFMAEPLSLSEQQRADLNEIAQARSLPAGLCSAPNTAAPTISLWKRRFGGPPGRAGHLSSRTAGGGVDTRPAGQDSGGDA